VDLDLLSRIRRNECVLPHCDEASELAELNALAQADIDAYDLQIASLSNLLLSLKNRRRDLIAHQERAESLLHPIRRLPRELLPEIFQHVGRVVTIGSTKVRIPVLPSIQTCSYWHEVAISCPFLWSRLEVNIASKYTSALKWVMELSKASLLGMDLYLSDPNGTPNEQILTMLKAQVHRWRYLFLAMPVNVIRDSFSNLPSFLPELVTLRLHIPPPGESLTNSEFITIFENAPKLKRLYANKGVAGQFHLPWEQLRYITMPSKFDNDNGEIILDNRNVTLDDMPTALTRPNQLESFYIRDLGAGMNAVANMVSNVEWIVIAPRDDDSFAAMITLFSHLQAENLSHVTLYGFTKVSPSCWDNFRTFLTTPTTQPNVFSNLSVLYLHYHSLPGSHIIDLLKCLRSVWDLALIDYDKNNDSDNNGTDKDAEPKSLHPTAPDEIIQFLTIDPESTCSYSNESIPLPCLTSFTFNSCAQSLNLEGLSKMLASRRCGEPGQGGVENLIWATVTLRCGTLDKAANATCLRDLRYLILSGLWLILVDQMETVLEANYRWAKEPRVSGIHFLFVYFG
jgi:hypothetical protein